MNTSGVYSKMRQRGTHLQRLLQAAIEGTFVELNYSFNRKFSQGLTKNTYNVKVKPFSNGMLQI